MIFYITESIGGSRWVNFAKKRKLTYRKKQNVSHVKVGIATNVNQHFKEYNIVLPYLSAVRQIVVRKSFARNLEKMFKYYLHEFRLWTSECYQITPKEAIFFLSRCYISSGKVIVNYMSKYDDYLIYLDSIYFGKKIPLFMLKRIRKFKKDSSSKVYHIELIKDWGRKKTREFLEENYTSSNFEEIIEDKYSFSRNILFHFIKRRMLSIQNQINHWNENNEKYDDKVNLEDVIEYFSEKMFWVLRDYNNLFKNNKNKRKVFLNDFNFFDKKLKSGQLLLPKDNLGYIAARIRAKYFYSLSWMYDSRGSPSNSKNDPYMFKTEYRYWTNFNATPKNYLSLLSNKK